MRFLCILRNHYYNMRHAIFAPLFPRPYNKEQPTLYTYVRNKLIKNIRRYGGFCFPTITRLLADI